MRDMEHHFDVAVVGGGLAGIVAAFRLATDRRRVALIDRSPAAVYGQLGGFAKLSGAKFSGLPAGQGLIPVAGSIDSLQDISERVHQLLGLTELTGARPAQLSFDTHIGAGLSYRAYDSIVLTPSEMDELIRRVSAKLAGKVSRIDAGVTQLVSNGTNWEVVGDTTRPIAVAPIVIYAGGRLGGSLLERAGAVPQEGKGLDVGVRIEFIDKLDLHRLRCLGPDAKVLGGNCRTFCLNMPGLVYRYPFDGFTIPGGIVADDDATGANVGLLCRTKPKREVLTKITQRLATIAPNDYEEAFTTSGEPLIGKIDLLKYVYGDGITHQLLEFAQVLDVRGFIRWSRPHIVHFPLLDWHWSTFAIGATHATSLNGLHVAGDSAGHARGLLQAAISGWLVAEEIAT